MSFYNCNKFDILILGIMIPIGVYSMLLGGIINEVVPFLGLLVLLSSFSAVSLVRKLLNANHTRHLENIVKTQDGYLTKGTLIARELVLSREGVDECNELVIRKFYKVGFEYVWKDGKTYKCECVDTFEQKDTDVMIWLNDNVDIMVYNNKCCTIETNLEDYYNEDVNSVDLSQRNIQESRNDASASFAFRGSTFMATGVMDIFGVFFLGIAALDMIQNNTIVRVSIVLAMVGFVLLFVGSNTIYKGFVTKQTLKHGVEAEAEGFTYDEVSGDTLKEGKYYRIIYSYELPNGKIIDTFEYVGGCHYVLITRLETLPIRIYKNHATIDTNKLIY